MWQMAGFGPMLGQAHHFLHFGPGPMAYPMRRYVDETARLYGVLDRRLEGRAYICDDYSIADMACWPWVIYHALHEQRLEYHPNVKAWFERMGNRPAIRRATEGLQIPTVTLSREAERFLYPERSVSA
jgi:GSH-dependent disulfide-bond oxidoreductase